MWAQGVRGALWRTVEEVGVGLRLEAGILLVSERPAEFANVFLSLLDLTLAFPRRPAESVAHQLRDARDRMLGRLRVEVREAHAQGEHVLDGDGVLVGRGVLDLRLDERVAIDERLVLDRLLRLVLAHGEGGGAVRVRQVARDGLGDAILLDKLHVEQVMVPVAAEQLDALGHARPEVLDPSELPLLDHAVDELLRHRAVRRPLAAANEDDL